MVKNAFQEGLRRLGLGEELEEAFLRYRQELLEWNTRFNLTAIKDPEEVMVKHFLDSLSLLTLFPQEEAALLDIGTGPGFPGLPLKIARPRWHVTLLEATNKKVTFLRHMVDVLGLENVEVIHGRAEELGHKAEYRAAFDLVTARAVAALPALLEYCAPYCRVGGTIILPKKGDMGEEIAHGKRVAPLLGIVWEGDVALDLSGLDDGRRLLTWKQCKLCPEQYPRSGAAMAKRPLG